MVMPLDIQPVRQAAWMPLPFEGCHNVQVKMLLKLDHLGVTMLQFEPDGTIHEHSANMDIDVICLEGEGMVSIGDEQAAFKAGERIRWTAGLLHCLWTTHSRMVTLMIEHYPHAQVTR
jgi:quercetin dioxygenase-like cupin family protein